VAPDEALGAHSALCVLCAPKVSSDGSKRLESGSVPRRVSARIDEYEMVLYQLLKARACNLYLNEKGFCYMLGHVNPFPVRMLKNHSMTVRRPKDGPYGR